VRHSYIDKYSNIDSPIHRLDARVKLIYSCIFILFVVFTPIEKFFSLALYGMLTFVLILFSRVPLMFVLRRSAVVIPFVIVISIFIPFLEKVDSAGYSLGILNSRWLIFWNIAAKSFLCVLTMILLVSTTKLSNLLKALERIKAPLIFIMILSFMYRYIFVVADELMRMQQAKKARSVGGSRWFHNKVLANMVGVLFLRTYERAENVYLAMNARGFNGTIKTLDNFSLRAVDYYFLVAMVVLLFLIRFVAK